jgi:DNA-binding NarL/FixJ family response regulator
MKSISVKGVTYYLETEDELIDLAHQLAREGYTVQQIASLLNISERTVKKYLSDCW